MRELTGIWLGRRRYTPVLALQEELVERRRSGAIGDVVLFLEHEPVITQGRGAHAENILLSSEQLRSRNVDLVSTARGGDVTLHAPGQLVAYPILDLSHRQDVRRYVGDLTRTMAAVCRAHGIDGGPVPEMIGLWVYPDSIAHFPQAEAAGQRVKVGAIGVRLSRWVSMHGFALNLTTDLKLFELIVPCGIKDYRVSSVEQLTGKRVGCREAASVALPALAKRLEFVLPSPDLIDATRWPLGQVVDKLVARQLDATSRDPGRRPPLTRL